MVWEHSLMSMPGTKRAVYTDPLIPRDLHWGRYGLNPDVRPYLGTDHIWAQKFMSLACSPLG